MTRAVAIVLPRDVVQVNGGPERRREMMRAGGPEQPEGVDHHARNVRLAVKAA